MGTVTHLFKRRNMSKGRPPMFMNDTLPPAKKYKPVGNIDEVEKANDQKLREARKAGKLKRAVKKGPKKKTKDSEV